MTEIELHPLKPFLPKEARILMLGSFPPPRHRWSMDFFYPNWNNDMWRITALIFFGRKDYFEEPERKAFARERLTDFLSRKGIALYDTACEVRRLQQNASDKYLEVVKETDIEELLNQLPLCQAIVTTGEKATHTLCTHFCIEQAPTVGSFKEFTVCQRTLRLYRMPSSSRAYPLSLEKKASAYRLMYQELCMVQ